MDVLINPREFITVLMFSHGKKNLENICNARKYRLCTMKSGTTLSSVLRRKGYIACN